MYIIISMENDCEVDPNKEYDCSPLTKSTKFTKLMLMVRSARFSTKYLKDINATNDIGWTALMIAARNSRTDNSENIVRLLLENNADPNLKSNNELTALIFAAGNSRTDSTENTVQMLLANKADPNLKNNTGTTALMLAAKFSKTNSSENTVAPQLLAEPTVQMLLANKADPNLKDNDGSTALMMAAGYAKTVSTENTVQMLLANKADPNLKNNGGMVALMYAACNSKTDSTENTVQMLLANKADPNLKNNNGTTALMFAARNSKTDSTEETVLLLLDYKADPNFGLDRSILNYTDNTNIIDKAYQSGLVVTFNMALSVANNNNKNLLNKFKISIAEYEINRNNYGKIVKSINNDYIAHFRNKPGSFSSKLAELNYGLASGNINSDIIMSNKLFIYLLSINNIDDIQNKLNLFLMN